MYLFFDYSFLFKFYIVYQVCYQWPRGSDFEVTLERMKDLLSSVPLQILNLEISSCHLEDYVENMSLRAFRTCSVRIQATISLFCSIFVAVVVALTL